MLVIEQNYAGSSMDTVIKLIYQKDWVICEGGDVR